MVNPRILVVEDDPSVSSLLEDVLGAAGYDVTTADSAFGAATLVRELQPSGILLDIGLPFRPGTDLLEELKSDDRTAHIPIVVISGLTEGLSEERCALAAAVLGKPFEIERLLEVLLQTCPSSSQGTGAA